MVTFLITSFILLAGITYVIYLWQRPSSNTETEYLPPPPGAGGLFAERALQEAHPRELTTGETTMGERRRALLERAAEGDKEALLEANVPGDTALYDEV